MSALDLTVEARDHLQYHHQHLQRQQRAMDPSQRESMEQQQQQQSVNRSASAAELNAAGSRRGSLQGSSAGSPLLQHHGSVSSSSSHSGPYSPMMGGGHKLVGGQQQDGHLPRGFYTSYEQPAGPSFYAPPPPPQHQFARPPPPSSHHAHHPASGSGYTTAPPPYRPSNGSSSAASSPFLPPLQPSTSNGYHLGPPYPHSHPSAAPGQQPPHRTYASYPAPTTTGSERQSEREREPLPPLSGVLGPYAGGQDAWLVPQAIRYGRVMGTGAAEERPRSEMLLEEMVEGGGRKRSRSDVGVLVERRRERERVEWSEGEEGEVEVERELERKKARSGREREQQRAVDDILAETMTSSIPRQQHPPHPHFQDPPPRTHPHSHALPPPSTHRFHPPAPPPSSSRPRTLPQPQKPTLPKPPPEKKFVCPHTGCNRAFARNFNLQSHIKSHMGVRDFDCPECSKKFSRKHDCTRHCVAIHGYDKESGLPPPLPAAPSSSSRVGATEGGSGGRV